MVQELTQVANERVTKIRESISCSSEIEQKVEELVENLYGDLKFHNTNWPQSFVDIWGDQGGGNL